MNISGQQEVIAYAIFGLTVALILGPIIIRLANRVGLLDVPNSLAHKQHDMPTPLAGGTILILTLILLVTILGMWDDKSIRTILIGAGVIYLFGLGDDALGFTAPYKLIGQLIAAGILIANGLSVRFFESLGELFLPAPIIPWVDIFLTLLWLIGMTNAMNLIDSMDGLVSGLCAIIFLYFAFATLESGQLSLGLLVSSLLGICLALLVFNTSPAVLFLGDSGAQTLGFLAAAIGMVYAPQNLDPLSTWFVPILLLIIPIFDTTLVVVSRIKHERDVFSAGMDHTYHRLVALGIPGSRAVYIIQLAAIFFSGLAFIMMRLPPGIANIGFGLILLLGAVLIIAAQRINIYPDQLEPSGSQS